MRDFREELKNTRFWDADFSRALTENGAPDADVVMQIREEVIALCEWIEANRIKSYLEIGVWTGGLIRLLHNVFRFDRTAACDLGAARALGYRIELPPGALFFEGNSHSPIYPNWRSRLGKVDLTFLDAGHDYEDVKRNFEVNASFPHQFIALHGIAGSKVTGTGVKRFWAELPGKKVEIIRPHSELGLTESTMGIGIWCR